MQRAEEWNLLARNKSEQTILEGCMCAYGSWRRLKSERFCGNGINKQNTHLFAGIQEKEREDCIHHLKFEILTKRSIHAYILSTTYRQARERKRESEWERCTAWLKTAFTSVSHSLHSYACRSIPLFSLNGWFVGWFWLSLGCEGVRW